MERLIESIGAVLALGVLYVVLPVVGMTYYRFRRRRTVTCPRDDSRANVQIDAVHAAASAAISHPDLRIRECSHWPARADCDRACLLAMGGTGVVR